MTSHRPTHHTLLLVSAIVALGLTLGGCAADVRVTWKTETEMDTAGFNLYRSTNPDGPFDVQVNDALIPPSSDPLLGQEYSFVDRTARAGTTYFYELQEIERDGSINRFGPISARAGGLDRRHALVLAPLAILVLLIWWLGGRARRSTHIGDG